MTKCVRLTHRRPQMSSSVMVAACALLTIVCACPTGTDEDEARIIDLGGIELHVWDVDNALDDARDVTLVVTVDGERRERTFQNGDALEIPDVEAGVDGAIVSLELRTDGNTLADAWARTADVALVPGGDVVVTDAILSASDAMRTLSNTLPDARTAFASCVDDNGRALILGGVRSGILALGSIVVDPSTQGVRTGPGQPIAANNGACAFDGNGGAWILGGCTVNSTGTGTLAHVDDVDGNQPFATDRAFYGDGCGARLTAFENDLWAVVENQVFLLDRTTGATASTFTLSSVRRGATVAADAIGVVIVGGFSDVAQTNSVAGGIRVLRDGTSVFLNELDGAALTVVDERVHAAFPDRIARVEADALAQGGLPSNVQMPSAQVLSSVTPLPGGRFLALSQTGTTAYVVSVDATTSISLATARPGGRLLPSVGGAAVLIGGDVAGASVFVVGQ